MDRREFLTSTGAVTAATAGLMAPIAAVAEPGAPPLAAPNLAASARTMRIALPRSIETLATGMAARRLAQRLQSALADGTRVEVLTTNGAGADAVSSGIADAWFGLDSDHAHLHRAFAVFSGMPTGEHMNASEQHAWLIAGDGNDLWNELASEFGFRVFAAGHTGAGSGLLADRLIDHATDFSGLRMAGRGLARDLAIKLGASVVDLDEAALSGGLAAIGLDAVEPVSAPTQAVAYWSYEPGLMAGGMTLSLGFSAQVFSRLPSSEQMIIEAVAAEARAHTLAIAAIERASLARVAALRRWPVVTAFAQPVEEAVAAAAAAVVDELASLDPLAARVVASHRNFRATLQASGGSIA